MNIGESQIKYVNQLAKKLAKKGARVKVNSANETIGKKIREAEIRRVPYIVVVGDKELVNQSANVRHYTAGQLGEMKISDLVKKVVKEIRDRI